MSEPYEIRYAAAAVTDVRALRAFNRRKVLEGIELHLTFLPQVVSRTRIKAMAQPFWSQYRLRLDDFRVYYDVDEDSRLVQVLRVLRKTTDSTRGIAVKTIIWTENISLDDVMRPGEPDEVLLMRDGHVVALLIPFDDDDLAWYARERDPAFLASIAKARQQIEQGDTLGHDELKSELGID